MTRKVVTAIINPVKFINHAYSLAVKISIITELSIGTDHHIDFRVTIPFVFDVLE